jgi:GDSL-like Lipase/Acylhydrolase
MEIKSSAHIVIFINILTTLFASSTGTSTYDSSALFIFGDSTVDTGNNNNNLATFIKADSPPYGENFPAKEATGRFSDGKVFPDFILGALNLSGDSLPAYSGHTITANDYGVFFASAGSGLDDETAKRVNVSTMGTQLEEFRNYIENMKNLKGYAKTQEFIKKYLYIISVGSNDIVITYYMLPGKSMMYSLSQYHTFLVLRLKAFLKVISINCANFRSI